MSAPKVLIDAQWRPDHFAAPVFPGFKAIPLANRQVPFTPAVSFINVIAPSTTVFAQGGHKLFLLRSLAQDPFKLTQFKPDEAAESDPVEGSIQCVHGNTGIIFPLPPGTWPTPPLPGAINCGVIGSKDVDCLIKLKEMVTQMANRLLNELMDDPWAFYKNWSNANRESMAAWLKTVPRGVWGGIVDTVKDLGTAVVWAGGTAWDGVKAAGHAIAHPVDTYNAAAEAIDEAATAIKGAYDTLSDPVKRQAILDEIEKWLLEQLADLACDAADALQEMLLSQEPLAAQFGKLEAAITQMTAEVATQVAVTVLGEQWFSKVGALASKVAKAGQAGGKLGKLSEGFSKLSTRIRDRLAGKKHPETPHPKPSPVPEAPKTPEPPKTPEKTAGGAPGQAEGVGCKLGCNTPANPVNTAYGCKVQFGPQELDFDLPAPLPLPWQRTYASDFAQTGWLGQGWSTPFSVQIQRVADGLELVDEQGRRIPLPEPRLGQPYHSRFEQFILAATEDGGFEIYPEGGDMRLHFGALGVAEDADAAERAKAPLYVVTHMADANGNRIELRYPPLPPEWREPGAFEPEDAAALILPNELTDSAGRRLRLDFAAVGGIHEPRLPSQPRGQRLVRVVQLTGPRSVADQPAPLLPKPRVLVSYAYSDAGDLIEVRNALNQITRQFSYTNHVMVEHRTAGGIISRYEYTEYAAQGKVLRNWINDGRQWRFDYGSGYTDVTHTDADDPKGRTKRWFHDQKKNYTGHIDEMGGHLTRQLDAFANLTQITDEAGRVTRYTLNTHGQPTEIAGPDGAATRIAYHPVLGKITEITDPLGAATRYRYDARGNLLEVTDALGHSTCYSYDERGLPVTITDALGKTKHLEYNPAGLITRYTDCSGQSTAYAYDDWGHLRQITDALGQSTRYQHDALGRLLTVQHPDDAAERFEYDAANRLTAYTDALGRRTQYTLAADGLPVSRTNAEGGTLSYEYDGARRLKALLNENQARYDFVYDALDRLIEETGFDGRRSSYRYDPSGLIQSKLEQGTFTEAQRQRQTTDTPAPNVIPPQRTAPTIDDPWGLGLSNGNEPDTPPGQQIVTRYQRDKAGRLTEKQVAGHIQTADGTLIPQHKSTRYRWDEAGQLTEAANSQGAKTELAYDLLGQLIEETRIGQGIQSTLKHRYDELGNRTQTTLPNGQRLNWLHYGSGHLHQINLDGQVISDIERDALHRETSRTQGQLQSRYGYDRLGRLKAQAAWKVAPAQPAVAGVAGTQRPGAWAALGDDVQPLGQPALQGRALIGRRYQYDAAGNLSELQDLRGDTSYQYDRIGRISSASQSALTERFAFDPAHNIVPVQDGAENKDKAQGAIKNNRLEVFEDKRYRYDTHGNLIEKKLGKHTVIQLTWDVEHQLQSAQVTKAAHTTVTTETKYRYDAFGRRLEKKDDCGSTLFEWDGNRLLSERKGAKHKLYVYEADSFAPLAQVQLKAQNFKEKQPLAQTRQAQTAIELIEQDDIADWQPRKTRQAFSEQMRALQLATIEKVKESQAKGQQQPDFDETRPPLLEDQEDTGSNVVRLKDWRVRYYHNDHLGTPRELSDEGGDIVWQATYRAWGNTLKVVTAKAQALQAQNDPNAQEEPIEQNLRFQGQYYDEETGLHYNQFRYYDPDIGRFISQDPIGLIGGENTYQYAPNPISWADPLGLKNILGRYHGKKPSYANPGHHQPGHPEFRGGGPMKTSILPKCAKELYEKAIPDISGKHWYALDSKGVVHIFRDTGDGTVHWAGDSSQGKGIDIPKEIRDRIKNGQITVVDLCE